MARVRFNSGLSNPARLCGRALGHGAELGAVAADSGELQRRKNQIDVLEEAAADQGERSAGQVLQARERLAAICGGTHTSRGVGAISRMVPSISSRIAHCRRSDVSVVVAISIVEIGDVFLAPHVHIPSLFDKRQRPGDRLERFALRGDAPGRFAIAAAIIRKAPSA